MTNRRHIGRSAEFVRFAATSDPSHKILPRMDKTAGTAPAEARDPNEEGLSRQQRRWRERRARKTSKQIS